MVASRLFTTLGLFLVTALLSVLHFVDGDTSNGLIFALISVGFLVLFLRRRSMANEDKPTRSTD